MRLLLPALLLSCAKDEPAPSPYGCGMASQDTAPVFEVIDENIDNDGDGLSESEGDCDDNNCNVYPDAPEYNWGIDSDCDGIMDPLYGCGETSYDSLFPLLGLSAILRRRRTGPPAREPDGVPK